MSIMPDAIRDIVAKFGNSSWHVRNAAIYGFVELTKLGNL